MKKHPIFLIVATVLIFWGWLVALAFGAEITGPNVVQIGQLATFESTTEGDFTVYPRAAGMFAKDTNRRRMYFASPTAGEYSIIFFGLEEGQPAISTCDFVVTGAEPQPEPEPAPNTTLTAAEKRALGNAASAVVRGIGNGVVTQPNHARMEFKRIATVNLGGTVSDGVQQFLGEWSETHAVSTLDELKVTFEALAEELK